MPRKTNDSSKNNIVSKSKKVTDKSAKKPTTDIEELSISPSKKIATHSKKNTTKASSTNSKKATSKSSTKKSVSKSTKKNTAKKNISKNTNKKIEKAEHIEYYDLPYRYNQTVVKILAQTPTTLFVYWDISDEDKKEYIKRYGENFFENTIPILLVKNKTMNYSFEIQINDFANSWYFNVKDAQCDYEIELGRKAKQNILESYDYIPFVSSNIVESPNNHILFEKNQKIIFFKNIKTNTNISKDITQFNFMKYAGKIYNIYKEMYTHEELENLEKLSSSRLL